jgi:hypothetical protein
MHGPTTQMRSGSYSELSTTGRLDHSEVQKGSIVLCPSCHIHMSRQQQHNNNNQSL